VSITSGRGDSGYTDLMGGRRVAKDSLHIECLGELDELSCRLGWAACASLPENLSAVLRSLQEELSSVAAYLAAIDTEAANSSAAAKLAPSSVAALEAEIARLEAGLSFRGFVLPGQNEAAARVDLCRSQCRRVERLLVTLHREQPIADSLLVWANRLSDLLFLMARTL
jgi:cob(I)alamin adenosyltransferase